MADRSDNNIKINVEIVDNIINAEKTVKQYSSAIKSLEKDLKRLHKQQKRTATTEGADNIKAVERQLLKVQVEMTAASMEAEAYKQSLTNASLAQKILDESTGDVAKSLSQLKSELQVLNSMSFEGLSAEEIRQIESAIIVLNQAIEAGEEKLKNFGSVHSLKGLHSSLEAASAATSLLSDAFKLVGLDSGFFAGLQNTLTGLMSTVQSLTTVTQFLEKSKLKAATASGKLTIAQKGLNLAMKAMPIIAIISGISSLIGGIKSLISWFKRESDACKAASEALNHYQEVAKQTQEKVQQISSEESSVVNALKEKHREELLALKQRGTTAVEIAELELRQQNELTDITIEASQKREEQLKNEQEANRDAISKQKAYLAELDAKTEETLNIRADYYSDIIKSFNSEAERQEYISKLRKEAYKDTEEERKKLEELTTQQEALNNKLRDEATIRQKASNDALEKRVEVDGTKGDQSSQDEDKADREKQKYINIAKQAIQQKKTLDVALIKAEKDYQSEDFKLRQEYEKRLLSTEQDAAKEMLKLQYQNGEISKVEYKRQQDVLLAQEQEFNNKQVTAQQRYAETLLKERRKHDKELAKVMGEEFKAQRIEVTEEYEGMIEDIQALQKKLADDPIAVGELELQVVELRKKLEKELKAIDKNEQTTGEFTEKKKKYEEDVKAAKEAADQKLLQFADNEQEKYKIEIERLEAIKKAKEELGEDTSEEAAAIRATELAAVQAEMVQKLAVENLTAKKRYDIKRDALQKELELFKKSYGENSEEFKAKQAEIDSFDEEFQQKRFERIMAYAEKAKEVMGALFEFGNAQDEAKLQKATEENEQEKQQLQAQLDANLITKEEYDKKVKQSDDKLAKEQAKIARKKAVQDKANAIFDVGVKTAQSIMASSKPGFPTAIPFVAMSAALGALQLAAVLAQPLPKAARGKYLKGVSHAQGGIQIEAEGGEMIINKRSASMFAPLLSAINEAGGGVPFVSSYSDGGFAMRDYQRSATQGYSLEELGGVFKEAVQEVKIYTAIEDINEGSKKYAAITDSSTF